MAEKGQRPSWLSETVAATAPPVRRFKKWHLRKVRDIVGKLINNLSKLAMTIFTLERRAASLDLADDG
jgi:hypothetical protein